MKGYVLVFLLLTQTTGIFCQTPSPPPNIIFIILDDLNDYTGFLQGHPQSITPNMDRLARQGTTFSNAIAAVPVCAPSRNCFLTGKAPEYSKVFRNEDYVARMEPSKTFRSIYHSSASPLQVETIPAWLKDRGGYYTIGMGKVFHGWQSQGYDQDYDASTADPCSKGLSWNEFHFIEPFGDPEPIAGLAGEFADGVNNFTVGRIDDSLEQHLMEYKQANATISFLQNYRTNPDQYCNRPFFLAIGMYRPHQPFTAPKRYFLPDYQPNLYERPYDLPYNNPPLSYPTNGVIMPEQPSPVWSDYASLPHPGQVLATRQNTHNSFQNFASTLDSIPSFSDTLSLIERRQVVAESRRATAVIAYLASIRFADAQIGRILDALEADPKLAARTVVVLVSDNGFSHGQKQHWFKNALWETDQRIPLLVKDPREPGGQTVPTPVSTLDLFPTICDLAGVPEPLTAASSRYLDGQSLRSHLGGSSPTGNRPAVSAVQLPDLFTLSCFPFYSVRTDNYHLIRYRTPPDSATCDSSLYQDLFELYDIGETRQTDPQEWNNLADHPAYQNIRDWLASFIPGEKLAGTTQPQLRIINLVPDCDPPGATSEIMLKAVLSPAGSGFEPAEFAIRWRLNDLSFTETGDTLRLSLASLPAGWLAAQEELVFQVAATDSLNVVVAMDHIVFPLNSAKLDPTFTAAINAQGIVRVQPLTTSFPSGPEYSVWDFGDGVTLQERFPAPHRYTTPGSFLITHTRFFSPESSCSSSHTQLVQVDSGMLANTCLAPYPPEILTTSANGVHLATVPVFQSTGYQWQLRSTKEAGSAWLPIPSEHSPELFYTLLEEDQQYEVQVRAQCLDSTASDWSAPVLFTTSACRPPFGIQVTSDTTYATVSWQTSPDAFGGTALLLQAPGQPNRQFLTAPAINERFLSPLLPDYWHRVRLASVCRALDGTSTLRGRRTVSRTFRTLAVPEHSSRVSPFPAQADLHIWPNPTSGEVNIIALGTEQNVTLQLISEDGRIILTSYAETNMTHTLNLGAYPDGLYWLQWKETAVLKKVVLGR